MTAGYPPYCRITRREAASLSAKQFKLIVFARSLIESYWLISVRLLKNLHFAGAAIAAAAAAFTQVIAAGVLGAIYADIARRIAAYRTDENAGLHLNCCCSTCANLLRA